MGAVTKSAASVDAVSVRLARALKQAKAQASKAGGVGITPGPSQAARPTPAGVVNAGACAAARGASKSIEKPDEFSARLAGLLRNRNAKTVQSANSVSSPSQGLADATPAGPVGAGDYIVKPGECISSIAKSTGHFWETIWIETANAELRDVRQNPNVLLEGDRVTVPPAEPKYEPGVTEQRHRFVRRGEPSLLRLRVLENDKPRGNERFTLEIDAHATLVGTTDADGNILIGIPGDARQGKLTVGSAGKRQMSYLLQLGQTDPVSTLTGVQQRLSNLGYDCRSEIGAAGPKTRSALRAFQEKQGLSKTAEADHVTRERLQQVHGS